MQKVEIVREIGQFKNTLRKSAGVGFIRVDDHEPLLFAVYQQNLLTGYISFICMNKTEQQTLVRLLTEGGTEENV